MCGETYAVSTTRSNKLVYLDLLKSSIFNPVPVFDNAWIPMETPHFRRRRGVPHREHQHPALNPRGRLRALDSFLVRARTNGHVMISFLVVFYVAIIPIEGSLAHSIDLSHYAFHLFSQVFLLPSSDGLI